MKKSFQLRFIGLLFVGLALFSCKEEEKDNQVQVKIVAAIETLAGAESIDMSGVTVKITELRSQKTITATFDANNMALISVDKGTYTFNVDAFVGEDRLRGKLESHSITKDDEVSIEILVTRKGPEIAEGKKGIIFKEIFFNGETNLGRMMHPDQYFVLVNNSEKSIYADGITFAMSARASFGEADGISALLPHSVVASMMYSIPGDGKTYLLQPGEEIVIAATAINHNAQFPNSVDLSGADFEVYDANIGDVDNPDVPNLIAHYSAFGEFFMQPKGFFASFIFHPGEEDMESFLRKNAMELSDRDGNPIFVCKVPSDLILDGIETGVKNTLRVKSLPITVDAGFIGVEGCHGQELVLRKSSEKNGRVYYEDTDNSTNDCIVRTGQNSFPKK